MTWSAGRFARVHLMLGVCSCAMLVALAVIQQLPKERLDIEPSLQVKLEKTPSNFPALKLKPMDLIESSIDLSADFHASTFLMRPGAMTPSRALCLRDLEKKAERDVTEGRPIYLRQEKGRLTFALLGEKTPLWALPERTGDRVSLDIFAHIQGEDRWIKRVEIPFDDAKPWPAQGVESRGLLIDGSLFNRLGLKWYGKNRLDPTQGERLIFERSGHFCCAKKGQWFSLSAQGFGPIAKRGSKYDPVIQLKEITEKSLEFEVVDADAQCALRLCLARTPESLTDTCMQALSFLGRRQLNSAYLESCNEAFKASFGEVIFFSEGKWARAEKAGPALRIDGIERIDGKEKLVATLFSSGRSLQREVTLAREGQ